MSVWSFITCYFLAYAPILMPTCMADGVLVAPGIEQSSPSDTPGVGIKGSTGADTHSLPFIHL